MSQVEELASEEEDPLDPVTLLWRTFRRGYPLLAIFNALEPETRIGANEKTFQKEAKREQSAAYNFLVASQNLHLPVQDSVRVSDLYGEDTAGFAKVSYTLFIQPSTRLRL